MQVGRKGKGMKAQREILAKLASRLRSSASLQKSASAASKAYRSSNLRILWIDAGEPSCKTLRPIMYFEGLWKPSQDIEQATQKF